MKYNLMLTERGKHFYFMLPEGLIEKIHQDWHSTISVKGKWHPAEGTSKTHIAYEDDGTVNVKNGILSFSNEGAVEFLPHAKENISFKQFNAVYDPEARFELLDDTLLKWFSGDTEQIELFNQLLGYLLMNHVNYQKIFFFIGVPHTGKTTLLNLMTAFCGKENVSAVKLSDMNKPFELAPIKKQNT